MSQQPSSERPSDDAGRDGADGADPEAGPAPGAGERGDAGDGETAEAGRPVAPPLTQQIGRGAVLVLAVLFGIFAVINRQFVDFHWVFGGTEVVVRGDERIGGGVPLIVLLVSSFVVGIVTGWFATWWVGRSRRFD